MSSDNALDGKVAIVTGAGSGIGRAVAVALAEHGARVVVADVDDATGEETAKMIDDPDVAVFVHTDVSNEEHANRTVKEAISRFGRLDVAVNNAAINIVGHLTADISKADWDRVIGVNLTGVFLGMKAQIPVMLEFGGGSIINTSSVEGILAQAGHASYVTAKHGVIGLTKAAALEYSAAGVRVNAILPGAVRTGLVEQAIREQPEYVDALVAQHPIGRFAEPSEIASTAVWLASSASSFVTGSAVVIDGGFSIH